jgi:ligand-binding SRPBCC domain-containing protein
MGKIYCIQHEQILHTSMEKAWDFFSRAENLAEITPSYMRFDITSAPPDGPVYAGQIITYVLRPVLGIPVRWMTEITHVKDGSYFVDEQRQGPYALWHHQHHFTQVEGGVKMTDLVHYALPLGPLGRLAGALFVHRQLRDIFRYRQEKIGALFGKP